MFVDFIERGGGLQTVLKYVNPGECFLYENEVYMRIKGYRSHNALHLVDGKASHMKEDTPVTLLETKVTTQGVEFDEIKSKETFLLNGKVYLKKGYSNHAYNLKTGELEEIRQYESVYRCTVYIEAEDT